MEEAEGLADRLRAAKTKAFTTLVLMDTKLKSLTGREKNTTVYLPLETI